MNVMPDHSGGDEVTAGPGRISLSIQRFIPTLRATLMGLKLFNTLARSVEEFVPLDAAGKKVGMYCCGPTVYDLAHIGNFRTFVFTDLVRRYLTFRGYDVTHVMNVTDVEDKIIKRVRETGQALREFTGRYEAEFLSDLKTLNCLPPHHVPHATEHIPEMIALIEKLIARGIAYQAADGSVYFSIEKYRGCGCRYGQLVKLNLDELKVGDRVASDEYDKESVADFALWKARVPEDGDVFWPSPWGEGRPGWHIECSAMSTKLLGKSFDLHLGGEDLVFPHHEDEIAQSEGAGEYGPNERFVKYWLHGAFLLVEGKKMSKSLGNFFTLRDLLAKGFTGREIRYLLLTAHYRETFNFTLEGLAGARSALARIDECVGKLREMSGAPASGPASHDLSRIAGSETGAPAELPRRFTAAMDEDLNVSRAWGAVFEWVSGMNRQLAANSVMPAQAAAELAAWEQVNAVFGVGKPAEADAPAELLALLEQRQSARKSKDFKRADAIREELKSKGWVIEDSPKGSRLKRL